MIRSKDHKFSLRLQMVLHARAHGIRPTARRFATTPKTVRRWLERFEQGGRSALHDRSRAPHRCPHKTSAYRERRILEARRRAPCFGPRRLKDLFGLKASTGAIARILRAHGLTCRRRKKHRRKNDLRAVKARYRCFERLQADTKPLYDIPAYWPQMTARGLARHQYTWRDVKSGALFIDYAEELSTTYALLGAQRILSHLQAFGVDLTQTVLTTDNGSEYGGTDRRERDRGFHRRVQACGLTHRFNPPATPNAHADVETSHRLIEDELFDLESFGSRDEFFAKVATYQRWWNFARPNYSKGGRTPAQFLQDEGFDPRLLLLTPIDLAKSFNIQNYSTNLGSHVPVLPEMGGGGERETTAYRRRPFALIKSVRGILGVGRIELMLNE